MCLYPKLIKNKKFTDNKKNGGVIPEVKDPRVLYVPVGCQECIECRKQKARGWTVRLMEDIKTNTNGIFVTLTFNNKSITQLYTGLEKEKGYALDNAIATKGMRLFLERWRKHHKKSVRHWMVTELGHNGTENIHLHGIIWTDKGGAEIEKHWSYGFVWKGTNKNGQIQNYVNARTINYITKYIIKQDDKHPNYKPKILTSKGIGKSYCTSNAGRRNKYTDKGTQEYYKTETGHKIAMPTYWRNQLYSDEERENLWLQKLDKEERWVCGEKFRANDKHTYYRLLEWHRARNGELGYGKGIKEWSRIEYENAVRQLMIEKRINKEEEPDWINNTY